MASGGIRSDSDHSVAEPSVLPIPRQADGARRDRRSPDDQGDDLTMHVGGRPHPVDRVRTADRAASVDQLTAVDQVAAAKAICLRLLAVAPRPRAGLAQALKRKEIPDDIAEAVLDRLTEVGLIDDVAYAASFVRTKQRDRALGRAALRTELRKLGVDEEIMAVAVDAVDSDAERARAVELIAKRLDAAMAVGPIAARRRLLGLLARRGYTPEVAISVVDQALEAYSNGMDEWS